MATVVLTAVGTAIGGPVGAAIGGLIGNMVDHAVLFRPKGREGTRLSDLQVQTSSYGTQIPKLFGTMRVAGTVIWATDLKESSSRSGGGKGRASVTSYSYSASFAVALSARPVGRIGRIWADGNLLRGEAGDFKTELSAFRLYDGTEEQAVDPLIASAQGVERTPAHRGIAYALFEDLALADYGNRIPSLTFEVEADDGPVSVGAMAGALSDGRMGGESDVMLAGYAAGGADLGEAVAALVEAHGLALVRGEDGLSLRAAGTEPEGGVDRRLLLRRVNGEEVDPLERTGGSAEQVPVALSVRHHDAARDYQAGVQRVTRPGPGRIEAGIDLPAAMSADEARTLAVARIGAAWTGRARMNLRCGWPALTLAPGAVVTVEGVAGLWRMEEREWEHMAVRLALRRVPGSGGPPPAGASSGTIVRQVDAPHGPTSLMLADLPSLGDGAASAPVVVAAASGGTGWRSAALFILGESGEATPVGRSAGRAVLGMADAALAPGSVMLVDHHHSLTVTLLATDMALSGTDEAGLAQGRNLCLVGRELIQFGAAERMADGCYRLTELRRGLRGTEWAMDGHEAGEPFLLIEADRLTEPFQGVGIAEAGSVVRLRAVGLGDAEPVEAMLTVSGDALVPPAPVHVTARDDGAGGWRIGWTRRSRAGWRWLSGGDVPLGEETERYAVRVLIDGVAVRTAETGAAQWDYMAAMMAADGAGPRGIEISQIGIHATGRAAAIPL